MYNVVTYLSNIRSSPCRGNINRATIAAWTTVDHYHDKIYGAYTNILTSYYLSILRHSIYLFWRVPCCSLPEVMPGGEEWVKIILCALTDLAGDLSANGLSFVYSLSVGNLLRRNKIVRQALMYEVERIKNIVRSFATRKPHT